MGDTINISWKVVSIIAIIALLLFGTFALFFGMRSTDSQWTIKSSTSSSSQDIPEKCRLPAGQDINSWKEHLGHHKDLTRDCLRYFN